MLTKTIIGISLSAKAAIAASIIGGLVGTGIGAAIGVFCAGLLVSAVTQFVINKIGRSWNGQPQEFFYDNLFSIWIPFRKNDICLSFGTIGL